MVRPVMEVALFPLNVKSIKIYEISKFLIFSPVSLRGSIVIVVVFVVVILVRSWMGMRRFLGLFPVLFLLLPLLPLVGGLPQPVDDALQVVAVVVRVVFLLLLLLLFLLWRPVRPGEDLDDLRHRGRLAKPGAAKKKI